MTRVPQSRDELEAHLADQLEFLEDACSLYDEGRINRFKQIATSIRILMHDSRTSMSLLGQLGLLNSRRWLDTAGPINPNNLMATNNLIYGQATVIDDKGTVAPSYGPVLDAWKETNFPVRTRTAFGTVTMLKGERLQFSQWWTMPVVKVSAGQFSRSDLVLAVANTDGGAHVDATLKEPYRRLSRDNEMGFRVNGDAEFGSPVPASLRQIAYEVLESLAISSSSELPGQNGGRAGGSSISPG
jgi:hypothetical protein